MCFQRGSNHGSGVYFSGLSPRRKGSILGQSIVVFVLDKVALGQAFLRLLLLSLVTVIYINTICLFINASLLEIDRVVK
jgi:hypothetical protein